jgi:hypothetical protein
MKIKITKCSAGFNWFNDHLGEVFEVDYRAPELYWVIAPGCGVCGVPDGNCIELPEQVLLNPDKRIQITNRLAQPIPVDLADRLIELSKPNFPSWGWLDAAITQTGFGRKMDTLKKLLLAASWVNEGWKPDWSNGNERKWSMSYLNTGKFAVQHAYVYADCCVCFKSEEATLKAIELFRANGDEQNLIDLLTS